MMRQQKCALIFEQLSPLVLLSLQGVKVSTMIGSQNSHEPTRADSANVTFY